MLCKESAVGGAPHPHTPVHVFPHLEKALVQEKTPGLSSVKAGAAQNF
jgi:hypothetical protein